MTWSPGRLVDGALGAGTINTILSGVSTQLNGIGEEMIANGCFTHANGGSPIVGFLTQESADPESIDTYLQATFGASLVYTTFGANDGSISGSDLGTGQWVRVGHPVVAGGGLACELSPPQPDRVGMVNYSTLSRRVAGYLLLGNIELWDINIGEGTDCDFMSTFRYQIGSDWYNIQTAETRTSRRDHVAGISSEILSDIPAIDVSMVEWFGPNQVDFKNDSATDTISGFDMVMSLAGTTVGPGASVLIRNYNFSVISFFSEDEQ